LSLKRVHHWNGGNMGNSAFNKQGVALPLAISDGGTGGITAAAARGNIGVAIGTDVQAYNANLTTYAGIAPSANVQTLLGAANYSAFKTSLSLNSVENTAISTWAGSANITTLGTIATGTWQGTTIAVNKGGTGQTTYTDGQLLIGNSSNNSLSKATLTAGTGITITNGNGTITIDSTITSGAPTTSQYVTLATDATLSSERVLTGTSNQITITDNGAGSTVVLSLPQNIHTAASPTFAGLNLGTGNISTMGNIAMDGEAARDLTVARRGTGTGFGLTIQAGGAQNGASNTAGGNLTLASGIATGNSSSIIIFSTASTAGSGTTDKTPAERMRLIGNPNGVLLIGVGSTSVTGPSAFTDGITMHGQAGRSLQVNRMTTSNTAGVELDIFSGGATSGATNKAAGNLVLGTGLSTGSGGGQILLRAPTNNAASTTDNSLVNRVIVNGQVALTSGVAATLITIPLATLQMAGGIIVYTIDASDGTDMISDSGSVYFAAVNKAGTYTTNSSILGTDATAKSDVTDTITNTFGFNNGTNQTQFQITSTITGQTPTTFRITYQIITGAYQQITAP
jgi:hypothetical protein